MKMIYFGNFGRILFSEDINNFTAGFASRLLLTDRRAYNASDKNTKPNVSSKLRRNEKVVSTPEEEYTAELEKVKSYDDHQEIKHEINYPRKESQKSYKDFITNEDHTIMNNKEEIPVQAEEKLSKLIKRNSETLIKPTKNDVDVKPKSKKEHRRKMSEKSSEESETPLLRSNSTQEELPNKIADSLAADTEVASVESAPVEPRTHITSTENEIPSVEPLPIKKHSISGDNELLDESYPADTIQSKSEPELPEEQLEQIEVQDQTVVDEIKEEIPLPEEIQTEVKDETSEPEFNQQEDAPLKVEEIKNEVEKEVDEKEVEPEEVEKENDFREDVETVSETLDKPEDVTPSKPEELIPEEDNGPPETESKIVDEDTGASDEAGVPVQDEDQQSLEHPSEPENVSLPNDVEDVSPIVESPTDASDVLLKNDTIPETDQVFIESSETEVVQDSVLSSDVEPLVEEPLSPEGTSEPYMDQNIE